MVYILFDIFSLSVNGMVHNLIFGRSILGEISIIIFVLTLTIAANKNAIYINWDQNKASQVKLSQAEPNQTKTQNKWKTR